MYSIWLFIIFFSLESLFLYPTKTPLRMWLIIFCLWLYPLEFAVFMRKKRITVKSKTPQDSRDTKESIYPGEKPLSHHIILHRPQHTTDWSSEILGSYRFLDCNIRMSLLCSQWGHHTSNNLPENVMCLLSVQLCVC